MIKLVVSEADQKKKWTRLSVSISTNALKRMNELEKRFKAKDRTALVEILVNTVYENLILDNASKKSKSVA